MRLISQGLRTWLFQRISAVYLLLFSVIALGYFISGGASGYADWHRLMSGHVIAVATALFFTAALVHAWIGVRDIVMDYVRPVAIRVTLLILLALLLLGMAIWIGRVLMMVTTH